MKKLLKCAICFAVALLCCTPTLAQEKNTSMTLQKSVGGGGGGGWVVSPQPEWNLKSETDDLLVGDTAYITLGIEESTSLYAFEGEITYDPTKLEFKNAVFPEDGMSKVQSPQAGTLQFVYSCMNDNTLVDSSKAVEFQFTCLSTENTVVTLNTAAAVNAGLAMKRDENLSLTAVVKMKKSDPPKKTSGSSGGGGSFGGGSVRPQTPAPQVTPTEPVPTTEPEPSEEIPTAITPNFQDLQGFEWAEEAIASLSAKNILLGTGGGNFEPSRSMTRAEAAKLLIAAFSPESGEGEALTFFDVEDGAWYTECIRSASAQGWLSGYEDGSFQPNLLITREDFAVILMRISQVKELAAEQDERRFTDFVSISDYAAEAVTALAARGMVQGDENGAFAPQAAVTRAEAARILYSILKSCEEGSAE